MMRRHPVRAGVLASVLAVCAGACGDGTGPENVPVPHLASVEPGEVAAGVDGVDLTIRGSGFVGSSVARWNGQERGTTYVGATELTMHIPAADVTASGTAHVSVINPPPGGPSGSLPFVVTPPPNPSPIALTVAPAVIFASRDTVIEVTGAGFVGVSKVRLETIPLETAFLSATALRAVIPAGLIDTSGIMSVRIVTPPPGGGTSVDLALEVHGPAPSIDSVAPSQVHAGTSGMVMSVHGSGFLRNSAVLVSGTPRQTIFLTTTRLQVTLTPEDLASVGNLSVEVETSASGGGRSDVAHVHIVEPPPVIAGLSSYGATAGSAGFTLSIYGARFEEGAVVTWNGAVRTTDFVHEGRIDADILAGDVITPGTVIVSVRNPGPDQINSAPETMTVRSRPDATFAVQSYIPVWANDVVYHGPSNRLLITTSTDDPDLPHRIVAAEPFTGQITLDRSIQLGAEGGQLELSTDSVLVYVALNSSGRVRSYNVLTRQTVSEVSLESGTAETIRVRPGRPSSIAVSSRGTGSPRFAGLYLFDGSSLVGAPLTAHLGPNTLAFSPDGSVLYGYQNESSAPEFWTMDIGPNGLTIRDIASNLGAFEGSIVEAGGRIYLAGGAVFDPELRSRVMELSTLNARVIYPDMTLGRIFIIDYYGLHAFDLNTGELLGTIPEYMLGLPGGRIARLGGDELAFINPPGVTVISTGLAR